MKLKNKKTGEIDDYIFEVITDRIDLYRRVGHSETKNVWHYNSLAELNAEWEDAPEEPKEYWYIYADGDIYKDIQDDVRKDNGCKEIGNYFETKEEAEKAVEKLKAWKRLKDKKAKIVGWCYSDAVDLDGGGCNFDGDDIIVGIDSGECDVNDLDLLFGGEE